MPAPAFHLALENTTPHGAVALGRGPELLGIEPIPPRKRHNVDLMIAVDALCKKHRITPDQLAAVFVSLGPGSFTGLRVAVTTAKMLALTLGLKTVGIPTLDLLCAQHPDAIIALNIKHQTAWSAPAPGSMHAGSGPSSQPALRTLDEIRAFNLPIIADNLEGATPPAPDVAVLYRLGHARLIAGDTDDPRALAPAYIRQPEAVTLWDAREKHPAPKNP